MPETMLLAARTLGDAPQILPANPTNVVCSRPTGRLDSFDSARVFAAAGVMWVHTAVAPGPIGDIGRFGTTFFTLAMVIFMIRHARRNMGSTYGDYLYQRTCRLLIPFVIWTCVALLAYCARAAVFDPNLPVPRPLEIVLATASPLWFLYFAFLLSALGYPAICWIVRQPLPAAGVTAGTCLAIGGFFAGLPDQNFEFLGQYCYLPERIWEVIPCIFWGVALEHFLHTRLYRVNSTRLAVFGLVLLGLTIGSYFLIGFTIAAKNLGGLGLMLMACGLINARPMPKLAQFGRLSFGIYLIHPFAISIAHLLLRYRGPLMLRQCAIVFVVALVLSASLTWMMRQWRATRWLVT